MPDRRTLNFVRVLIRGGIAKKTSSGIFRLLDDKNRAGLDEETARELSSDGVLEISDQGCQATRLARSWLKRNLSTSGDPADQHRHMKRNNYGHCVNLKESPLSRLAIAVNGSSPFLQPYHIESGERLHTLVSRALLMQRTTMSYDPNHIAAKSGSGSGASDISDVALDARNELHEIMRSLPRDCAGVLMDVCGFMKGLQLVESERGWPRRSAKLVLRVGLDQLAQHFGLSPVACGAVKINPQYWTDPDVCARIID